MKYYLIWAVLLTSLPLTTLFADHFTPSGYMPTRTLSMGHANRASATKTDAAYINPAAMISVGKKYIIDLSWQYGGDLSPNNLSAAAIDTKTTAVGGGIFINYYDKDIAVAGEEEEVTYKGLTTGLSYAYPLGGLVLGGTLKYIKYDRGDETELHTVTFDLAMQYRISEYIALALIGYNLTVPDKSDTSYAPLSTALSVMLGNDNFIVLTFDMLADFDAPDQQGKDESALFKYAFGTRVSPFDGLSLMVGYEIDQISDQNFWGLGVEYTIPTSRLEANFGYLQSTSVDKNRIFSFSLKIYL